MKWVRHFEQFHHLYLRDGRKKEFIIKRVFQDETYLLYSKGQLLIFTVIAHNETQEETLDIAKKIFSDAKEIENTSFIFKQL